MIITDEHREAARQQTVADRAKRKKSAAAVARLRAAAEREKVNKATNAALIKRLKELIASRPENAVEIIMDFMYRIRKTNTTDIRKRAIKAAHFLSRGFKLETIHDLMGYGELLPEDSSGHLEANYQWVENHPITIEQTMTRYPCGDNWVISAEKPESTAQPTPVQRRCALGSKCLRAYRRQPALVQGNSKYCSEACTNAARALSGRVKQANQRSNQSLSTESRTGNRMDTGVFGGSRNEETLPDP